MVDAVVAEGHARAILMERHGALTQGRSLEEAYNMMEELEFQARLQLLIGDVEDLPADEVERISRI